MTPATDVTRQGASALAGAFASGALSPTAALAAYLERIQRANPRLNAFLHLLADEAKDAANASALRWARRQPLSPIDGLAFGVKANIAVAGAPLHAGIGAYRNNVADRDAGAVAALRAAGAIPIGIVNMHEGALGATTDNPWFGRCGNPWDPDLTPGGSSGGSASAVAAGLCAFALGTDTMGSVRIPSAYCGIAGHKPTRGCVPEDGVIALSPTLDHVGVHARTARDLTLVMAAFGVGAGAQNPRVGLGAWNRAVDIDAPVRAAWTSASAMLGERFRTTPVEMPEIDFGTLRRRGLLVAEAEGFAVHRARLEAEPEGFSREFRDLLVWGARQGDDKVAAARETLLEAGRSVADWFSSVDVVALPTAPQGPFAFDAPVPANQADFTCIANFAGLAATAVPATSEGAPPASIQFLARTDAAALGAAVAFEARRGEAAAAPIR